MYVAPVKIGLWCGSLGESSANSALLRVAATRIRALGHEAIQLTGGAAVPAFDPALVESAPAAVANLRDQIRACDAVAIAAPEYAAGLAGSTKNALDWLVGDATIDRKVIGVASAGTTGGVFAVEQLVRTVSWQGGWVVDTLGISAPRTKSDDRGEITDVATLEQIVSWVDTVIGAVDGNAEHREALVSEVVIPYGINPVRFGSFD